MKVLHRDKIVETYQFPFSEALSFSILLWTIWGLIECLFWQKFLPFFDAGNVRVHPFIYVAAFLIYLVIAVVVASLVYGLARWVLFTMNRHDTPLLRSATLSLILAMFFMASINFVFQNPVAKGTMPSLWFWVLVTFTILIAIACLFVLFRSAGDEGFRIRRSGTTMMSVVVLSVLLALVHFPIFSSDKVNDPPALDLKSSTYKLMALHYITDQPEPSHR